MAGASLSALGGGLIATGGNLQSKSNPIPLGQLFVPGSLYLTGDEIRQSFQNLWNPGGMNSQNYAQATLAGEIEQADRDRRERASRVTDSRAKSRIRLFDTARPSDTLLGDVL